MRIFISLLFITSYSFSQLESVSEFKSDFDENLVEDNYQLSLSNSTDDDDNYYLDLTTYTNMYQATGDEDYLDFAVKLFENKVAQSSLMEDGYYGWLRDEDNSDGGITNGGGGVDGTEIVLSQSRGFGRTSARMFWILSRATEYLSKSTNQEKFDNNYEWFKTNICEKWRTRGNGNIYRVRTHMMSHWAQIGYFMNEIEPNEDYRKWYDDFNTDISTGSYTGSMRGQLRDTIIVSGTGYIWSGEWDNQDNTNDVNHANAEVELIATGVEYSDYWELDDLNKIIITFNELIFTSEENGSEYINGNTDTDNRQVWTQGWLKLGRFNEVLQERLQVRNQETDESFFYYKRGVSEMAYNKAYLDGVIYPDASILSIEKNQNLIFWRY